MMSNTVEEKKKRDFLWQYCTEHVVVRELTRCFQPHKTAKAIWQSASVKMDSGFIGSPEITDTAHLWHQ